MDLLLNLLCNPSCVKYAFNMHIVIFILHEYSLLLDAAKRSSVKEADAEEVVKKWLKAVSDRQGGRQR